MHILVVIALSLVAFKAWDHFADPAFNASYGWLVKTGFVVAIVWLVLFVLPIPWNPNLWDEGYGEPNGPVSLGG